MQVALRCPECGRCRVYNGRGRCRCGAYLIDHTGHPFIYTEAQAKRVYVFDNGRLIAPLTEILQSTRPPDPDTTDAEPSDGDN